ncbi:MAG TPA: translation initiation factor IF-2, partial [Candidatus Limnocylindrales bacterium]|nr:translation initiation factor IF-2 [Candidatus Limnocylindrales bacterium]
IRELIKSGIFATINQLIDRDTASLVASELGYEVAEPVAASTNGTGPEGETDGSAPEATKEVLFEEDDPKKLVPRAPIVTVMGHVDHGKTSLLDALRSTEVAAGERGGITQHIGASEIDHDGKRVVFLDTPGHEAFTAMRARGARVTDIAIIVVAADDGVMPQTLEAISHAKAAKVPIIIALNKIDKPDADPTRVKTELTEAGIVIEEYGGEVPLVAVSAKSGQGLDELIEMVLLVADLQELTANPDRPAIGTIVEAELDKNRGAVATALVQTGTLKVGDIIVVGETFGRVRALENDRGKRVKQAGPASAVVVLGLSEVPQAGDTLRVVTDDKAARTAVEQRKATVAAKGGDGSGRATLEDLYRQIQAGQAKELRIILKADVSGSMGAITHALEQLDQDEVRINVLHEAAGDITDNDIMLATASNAIVVGFNTSITDTARRAAEDEGVDVRLYDIIYKLTDDIDAALKGLLEPEEIEIVEGRAEVRQVIRVGKNTVIAGSYVTDGRIIRGGARIWRGGKVIATDRIESLRRFRDDVREVQANYECGIGLAGFHDIEEGDIIECFSTQTVSRAATPA